MLHAQNGLLWLTVWLCRNLYLLFIRMSTYPLVFFLCLKNNICGLMASVQCARKRYSFRGWPILLFPFCFILFLLSLSFPFSSADLSTTHPPTITHLPGARRGSIHYSWGRRKVLLHVTTSYLYPATNHTPAGRPYGGSFFGRKATESVLMYTYCAVL